jgi:hypothetical protein
METEVRLLVNVTTICIFRTWIILDIPCTYPSTEFLFEKYYFWGTSRHVVG